jgi:hypothetical protein
LHFLGWFTVGISFAVQITIQKPIGITERKYQSISQSISQSKRIVSKGGLSAPLL